jgi:hypothetical protein
MATLDDVHRIAMALPTTTEVVSRGSRFWRVGDHGFVWERPLRKGDLVALGAAAPRGKIVGVRVADVGVKEAMIWDDPETYFTIPHFDGYPAVLVRLERIGLEELREIVTDAWLLRAPRQVAQQYLALDGS